MGYMMNVTRILGMSMAFQASDSPYAPDTPVNPPVWHQISSALSVSMHRLLVMLARFFPGLVAFVIAVALFAALGILASFLLRKILSSARFDERVAGGSSSALMPNLQDWSPKHSPTMLAGRIAFWACVVLGFVVGISAFDTFFSGDSQVALFLLPYLTHSIGAILLLFAGNLIARFLARSVLIGAVNSQLQYARFLSLGIKWLVLVLTAAMVLDHLQIGGRIVELAFGILFGGIVLTLALAVGLGSREIVSRAIDRNTSDRIPDEGIAESDAPASSGESLRHF